MVVATIVDNMPATANILCKYATEVGTDTRSWATGANRCYTAIEAKFVILPILKYKNCAVI
jgi:hypothetical protein